MYSTNPLISVWGNSVFFIVVGSKMKAVDVKKTFMLTMPIEFARPVCYILLLPSSSICIDGSIFSEVLIHISQRTGERIGIIIELL